MNQKTIPPFSIQELMEQFYEQKWIQEWDLSGIWLNTQQLMHNDTHALILLLSIIRFTFVPWQIKSLKKSQSTVWPFNRLFTYTKGNQKPRSRSTALPKNAVQNKFHPGYVPLIRDSKSWITHTWQTPTLETQIPCSTLFQHLFTSHTHLYADSWKLSFQIALL